MAETERIPLAEVRDLIVVGEALPFRVLEAQGRLLLNQGQVVASERQLEMLVERGAWVERPRVEEVRKARGGTTVPVSHAQRQQTFFDLWDTWAHDFNDLVRRVPRERALPGEFEAAADALLTLIRRDSDVALFVCVRQDGMKPALYPSWHSMHCAVSATLTAMQLGWPEDDLRRVTRAALTMNIGMVELQATLAEQRDPPSNKQSQFVRGHPHASADVLRKLGVTDAAWLQAVQDHHERADGSGYPRGAKELSDAAMLLRIVDVYTAKITYRALRLPMAPVQAARELFQQLGHSALATALIHALGVHPPGALVLLQSGEVAVVRRRAAAGTAPTVASLSNKRGLPVAETHQRDSGSAEFTITGPCVDTKLFARIPPERVFGMVMA